MENFIVSARKYRPVTFDEVVGQDNIVQTLKNAIHNRQLAQAFLFCGPRGVGKTTCARILAKSVNCEKPGKDLEPCDKCPSCVSFNTSHSFNILELDAASNNSVDDIRTLIEQVRFAPQAGKYKVYIIDEVHMLSQSAFNAFLKTLEEPPAHAIFILATTEKHKIIPTILSRCQIYDFHRIQLEDIEKHLEYVTGKEKVKSEPDALNIIAQKADGSLRDALSIFDQMVIFSGSQLSYKTVIDNLNILDYDYYFRICDAILKQDGAECLIILNDIVNNGFDLRNFLGGLGKHFRDLLITKDPDTLKLLEAGINLRNRYADQATRFDSRLLLKGLGLINRCDYQFPVSSNQRLSVEILLMQLCDLPAGQAGLPGEIVQAASPAAKAESQKPPAVKEPSVSYTPQKKNDSRTASTRSEPPSPPSLVRKDPLPVITGTPGTISIASVFKKEKKQDRETESESSHEVNLQENQFTEEELVSAWNDFTAFLKSNGRMSLFTALSKRNPVKKENSTIETSVDYPFQAEEINKTKSEIIDYLGEKLKNQKIKLTVNLNPQASAQKTFTAQERYQKMVEKNPLLEKLRQELNLEIGI